MANCFLNKALKSAILFLILNKTVFVIIIVFFLISRVGKEDDHHLKHTGPTSKPNA